MMKLGIFNTTGTVDGLVEQARIVQEQGFSHFVTPQIFGLDALTAFAVVASEVPDIQLATGVVPTYRQHPMMLAQQALTVSQVSGGRLTLGIGLSHQIVVESMWGLSYERPLRHMREYLDILMPLLAGEAVSAEGETLVGRGELDVRAPKPEVVLAALGPKMLELAGRVAGGTATWMVGPKTLAEHIAPTINASADAAGRGAPQVIVSLPTCVTSDVESARKRAAEEFAMYGILPSYRAMLDREGVDGPDGVAVIGSADQVAERIAGIGESGATVFVASEFGTPDEQGATRDLLVSLLN